MSVLFSPQSALLGVINATCFPSNYCFQIHPTGQQSLDDQFSVIQLPLLLCYSVFPPPPLGDLVSYSDPAHHPSQPKAGFTGSAQCNIGRRYIRRGLQCLDPAGGLAGWAGAYDVYLSHAKAGGKNGKHISAERKH